jgi:hypothetical protein
MFLSPNRYSLIGFALLIIGFFTIPILIGLIIMPIGIVILLIGTFLSLWSILPGHQKLEPKIKTFRDQYIESSQILTMLFVKKTKEKPDFKE